MQLQLSNYTGTIRLPVEHYFLLEVPLYRHRSLQLQHIMLKPVIFAEATEYRWMHLLLLIQL